MGGYFWMGSTNLNGLMAEICGHTDDVFGYNSETDDDSVYSSDESDLDSD